MQITVNVPDEFAAQVQALGLSPEVYVEQLIAERTASLHVSDPRREVSLQEFNDSLDALTRYSDKIPSLPIESFSRESFYEDHD
jgi:hypothetical protein